MKYKAIPAQMRPNGTIEGLIRYYNSHGLEQEELRYLVAEFNRLNPDAQPPKPYQLVQMPVLLEYVNRHETKENPQS